MEITFLQILNLIIGLVLLIPALILLRQYSLTKVREYFYFHVFFLSMVFAQVNNVLASLWDILLLYQFHWWFEAIGFFFLFLYSCRIRWERTPKFVWYTGVVWFSLLMILTSFWNLMIQTESSKFLFWEVPHGQSSYYPKGAGIMLNGKIMIYSTAYNFLGIFFFLYTVLIAIYTYKTIDILIKTKKTQLARKLWLIAGSIAAIYWFMSAPYFPIFYFSNILILIAVGIISYIAIWRPEATILSNIQVIRIINVYRLIHSFNSEQEVKDLGIPSLIEYLRKVPPEYFKSSD